ncbi:unnamed protein product [Dibothriocephalus latus]|uniref:Uncharacterized protein n=1 Tax=Dibothriocephalus latus TaxID=60516 RepID=A0A3P6QFQ9_DIBLA|nr:unnamed protein product [Dibothriocephalus latus]
MSSMKEQMKITNKIFTKDYELRLQNQAALDGANEETRAFMAEDSRIKKSLQNKISNGKARTINCKRTMEKMAVCLDETSGEKKALSKRKKILSQEVAKKREDLKDSIAACEKQLATVIEQVKQSRDTIETLSPGHLALVKEAGIKEENTELILLRLNGGLLCM